MTGIARPAPRGRLHALPSTAICGVVAGGSQAGLAMAWHLARQQLRFVVLEAGPEPGHIWRSRCPDPVFSVTGGPAATGQFG